MERGNEDDNGRGDVRERSEPEQPPVDGPSGGSAGEDDDKDLADTSYDEPGGSGS
ncbi:hypothetical protein BH24ACT26_BH24ACT26_15410 [soil metagenome]